MKNDQSGFTIIELLVVVAFIGILATLALANFSLFKGQASSATAASDARSIAPSAEIASSESVTGTYALPGVGGNVPGPLGSAYGARYSPKTTGTIDINRDCQQYRIQTYQVAGDICYTLANGVLTATAGVCPTLPSLCT